MEAENTALHEKIVAQEEIQSHVTQLFRQGLLVEDENGSIRIGQEPVQNNDGGDNQMINSEQM